ncbi:MAG: DUF4405 domain-containing protein [Lachnospiraceae bacterium]|nr:DUF4405 domain-containing protein [Lachnospiraceae bacterium]
MKARLTIKMLIDIGMTGILLFLMAYALVGEAAHEWLGVSMFALFVLHHILNTGWIKNIGKGKYTAFRTVQTVLAALVLCTMAGSMISGIVLSRHVFAFLPNHGGQAIARTVHMLCAYWGFVLMSLHLGLHWNMVVVMAGKSAVFQKKAAKWICRALAILIAGYGCYAFGSRQIGDYLFSRKMFAFFDYSESLWWFILDYLAVMGLFVFVGYYAGVFLRKNHS